MKTVLLHFEHILESKNLSLTTKILFIGIVWIIGVLFWSILSIIGTFISGWLIAIAMMAFLLWTVLCIVVIAAFTEHYKG